MTNDKALHVACAAEGVPWMWGLQLLLRLVETSAMGAEEAIEKAEAIRASNPMHIKAAVLDRFRAQLQRPPAPDPK